MNRAGWVVAVLLLMLAALMGSHLALLHTGVRECDDLWKLQLEQAKRIAAKTDKQANIVPANSECSNVEADYNEAADRYIATILALLGGAGAAGGSALLQKQQPPEP